MLGFLGCDEVGAPQFLVGFAEKFGLLLAARDVLADETEAGVGGGTNAQKVDVDTEPFRAGVGGVFILELNRTAGAESTARAVASSHSSSQPSELIA